MSQLSFVDAPDTVRESAGGCCVTRGAEAGNGYFPSVRRLTNVQYSRSRSISVFRSIGCHLRRWEVFSDFLALAASGLDMARTRTPESMAYYQKICDCYTTADIENTNEAFSPMVCALEAKSHDSLGAISMELELEDNFCGRYFTPYSVQYLMARLLMPGIQDTIRRKGIVTASNPASGAAGMLTAYVECLLEADINPSRHMFGSYIGIDPVAADMVFIQLSLLGIAAEVVTGNTLIMQFNRARHTPVYYFSDFEKRSSDLNRHRVMLVLTRGLSDAT